MLSKDQRPEMTDQSTGKVKQKKLQTPENKGLQRYMLARLARVERAAFRLGVEFVQYPVVHHRVIQCYKIPRNQES